MKKHASPYLALAAAFVVALWGCGSNLDSGDPDTGPVDLSLARTVGLDNCLVCHLSADGRVWLESRHANANQVPAPSLADPACLACHDQLGDGLLLFAATSGQVADRPVVGCESCHGGGQYHNGLGPLPTPLPGPAQCGQCHGLDAALFHGDEAARVINDTHFDDPATGFLEASSNVAIEGYVVKTGDQRGCQACHFNGHRLDLSINLAWARSAHGGHILDVKDAAGSVVADRVAAAITDDHAPGWTHYNWDQTTESGNRAACQRCHTSTGVANYLNDPASYSPANNDFSHLAGWTPETGSPQNELLYCWGCHSDRTGALRNPGAITGDYTGAAFTYPDVGASNVCLACHIGRESGGTIAARAANPATDWGNQGFVNSHYLTAGGQVFSASGYHYAGLVYATPENLHAQMGTPGATVAGAAGTNGPCAQCHMSSAGAGQSHTFAVVAKDADGAITAINAPAVCNVCHTSGLALTVPGINALKAGFDAALEALRAQLAANGFDFQESFPYFTTRNWGDADTGPNNMGAAYNFNLLAHDPGAYAHNVRYATRLIWDSIDWLDDGLLNGSTRAAIAALDVPAETRDAALAWIGLARP
ncbi:MAG: hypothetical protein AB1578_11305 [Thermodesulfobacteriota bacterium]